MQHSSAMGNGESLSLATTWMNLEDMCWVYHVFTKFWLSKNQRTLCHGIRAS